MKKSTLLIFLVILLSPHLLFAQEKLSPVTKTYALKDVHIIQKPGQMIDVGTIVIKNGLIHAVGQNVPIPSNAKILKADSMYVYAGFIEGISHIGIPRPETKNQPRRREKNAANPTYKQAGIQPHQLVRDMLKPTDKSIGDMRKLGYTAAHVVPRGKMLPGKGSIILLNGDKVDDMVLNDQVSLFSQIEGAGGFYPATIMGVLSKYRELYRRAEQAKMHEKNYSTNPAGMARPNYDRVLKAFYPVIEHQQTVYFTASDVKTLQRVLSLQKELKFPLALVDVKQGWYVTDKIKSDNIPAFLSLTLPKDKSKRKKEGKKKKTEKESAEQMAFKKRQRASMKQHLSQAATFQDKGIAFGFTSINTRSKDIRENLRKMIEHGLKEETALSALTTVPARQLGLSRIMGTVETGKIANLVITDKPYFEEKSNVRFVLVDGQVFDYKPPKEKKGDPNANAKVAGKWSYKVEVPGESAEGTLVLKEEDGDISGKISNEQAEGEKEVSEASLTGNQFSFTAIFNLEGQSVKLEFDLIVDEDTMEGTVGVGEFGTYDVIFDKIPE